MSARSRLPMLVLLTAATLGAGAYVLRDRLPAGLWPGITEDARATAPAPPTPAAIRVSVVPAQRRMVTERLTVTGTLVAREEIMVSPETDGLRITDILVEEGDAVTKGQVLARLSRDMLETLLAQNTANGAKAQAAIAQQKAALVQAVAQQVEAEAAVERARTLSKTGATSQEVLDQRERAVKVAVAQVNAATEMVTAAQAEARQVAAMRDEIEVRLSRTDIRAPEAGLVTARSARLGAIVLSSNNEPLFRIVQDGAIDLDAEVPESVLPRIAVGLTAEVTPAGFAQPIAGKVRLVGAQVDRGTRLARVAIALPPGGGLKPGTFARGVIEIARRDGIALPQSAVQFGTDSTAVLVVKDGAVVLRTVKTGLRGEGLVEITEGLTEGDSVVARAAGFLREGDKVTPVTEGEAS